MNIPGPRILRIYIVRQPACTNVFTLVRLNDLIRAYQGTDAHAWGFAAGLSYLTGTKVFYCSCPEGDALNQSWQELTVGENEVTV